MTDDKIANLRDIKASPPAWDEGRIGAYIQFAEMVVGGCVGVNPVLDRMFQDAKGALS